MKMNKNEKGIKIVALAMTLVITGGCFTGCGSINEDPANVTEISTEIATEAETDIATEEATTAEVLSGAEAVFEKIKNDEKIQRTFFFTSAVIHREFSKEIEETENYFLWKSVAWALSTSKEGNFFKDYDIEYVSDDELGEYYYVVEPKVIDLLAMVLTGETCVPTDIPYEHPDFAEKTSDDGHSYRQLIKYDEAIDRYYVGHGELGAPQIVDWEYIINGDDTMTIKCKEKDGSHSYEFTVAYNPDDEVFGFTITDFKMV